MSRTSPHRVRSSRTSPRPRRALPHRALLTLPLAALLALVPQTASAYPAPGHVTGDIVVHDPSMLRDPSGRYLLHSTGEGLQVRTSADRITFGRAGNAFTTRPGWWKEYSPVPEAWAPDVSYHGGRYWMYYSVSSFGSNTSAIGLAVSSTGLPGSWSDRGVVIASRTGDDHNAIDPHLFVDDDGTWWLSFGSWWSGLKLIRIDPATGKRLAGDTALRPIAARPDRAGIEAPFIVKRNGYYYLFASYDRCCDGVRSTYRIKVGRATAVTGPYVDRTGTPLTNGGGTPVMESQGGYIGPGGQSVMRDVDGDLLVYHYYDGQDGGTPKLGVNLLNWSGGWPTAY
ncbi:arabinan endo-1,5-alpha-L-arabinosidase [Streptomyces sp. NPDC006307]|uniref:arabinan endo-1,5-alpha-L-arabinosidase n=1 Tax=Streptomyces sp. NPDC006307 TaxID=3156748 RepID=UPI0033B0D506